MKDFRDNYSYRYLDDSTGSVLTDPTLYSSIKSLEMLTGSSAGIQVYVVGNSFFPTLPSISNALYGTVDNWYILGVINNIDDLLAPLAPGYKIYYPSNKAIKGYLDSLNTAMNSNPDISQVTSKFYGTGTSQPTPSNRWVNGTLLF